MLSGSLSKDIWVVREKNNLKDGRVVVVVEYGRGEPIT